MVNYAVGGVVSVEFVVTKKSIDLKKCSLVPPKVTSKVKCVFAKEMYA